MIDRPADSLGILREGGRHVSTRDELLDAACRVVERVGPSASMQEMAAEAGITKPILYRHFGDKAGLLRALALRSVDIFEPSLTAVMALKLPLEERILIIATKFFRQVERDQALWLAMHGDKPGDGLLAEIAMQLCAEASKIIQAEIERDGLHPGLAAMLAEAIVGAAFRMAWRWVDDGGMTAEEVAADAARMVGASIRAVVAAHH